MLQDLHHYLQIQYSIGFLAPHLRHQHAALRVLVYHRLIASVYVPMTVASAQDVHSVANAGNLYYHDSAPAGAKVYEGYEHTTNYAAPSPADRGAAQHSYCSATFSTQSHASSAKPPPSCAIGSSR
jgi:hypothetical protein